ncbi:MAG TPA: hypothetical protein VEE82_04060, partial [Thermodesulfovibrionales bacterium]|nr:hypothetical protein [Thermodesulfovibrionales bacterium]
DKFLKILIKSMSACMRTYQTRPKLTEGQSGFLDAYASLYSGVALSGQEYTAYAIDSPGCRTVRAQRY